MTDPNNNSGNNSTPADPANTVVIPTITQNGWIVYPAPNTNTFGSFIWSYNIGVDAESEAIAEEKKEKLGCSCKRCKEFNSYAESNQDDGTFICYSCRKGW